MADTHGSTYLPGVSHTDVIICSKTENSKESLERVEHMTSLGHWTWEFFSDQILASREVFRMCGLEGSGPELEISVSWELIHPDDKMTFIDSLQRVLSGGNKTSVDYRIVRPDGAIRHIYSEMMLIADDSGRPFQIFGTDQDITERKLGEKQLADEFDAMARLHAVSMRYDDDFNTLLHLILDAAIAITRADRGNIQLLDPDSSSLRVVAHYGSSQSSLDYFDTIYKGQSVCGEAMRQEARVFVKDVTVSPIFVGTPAMDVILSLGIHAMQSTPLIGRSGRLVGMISTHWCSPYEPDENVIRLVDLLARQAADIIERKQSEEALRESEERYRALSEELKIADRRKDEFIGILSHEIRNPLASIMLCLSLLDRVEPGCEQEIKTKEIMHRQVTQLARLVDDLLDVTRINRNIIVLQKELVELNELVSRTVEDYQALFESKAIMLTTDLAPTALYMDADRARLTQVVGNLLHNAAKFTQDGGRARVSICKDKDKKHAVVCVEDSGFGMTPEMHAYLFQTFTQADTSIERSGGGLGLGLTLVKGLTELHGGTVSAHSDGLGKGSSFTIRLPLATDQHNSAAIQACSKKPYRSRRILVIEDIKDVAEALKTLLETEGHEVMVAYDGESGIVMAKSYRPEVLLCDIGLPGMDGYAVARAFCADEEFKDIYRISLTGYARAVDMEKSKQAGFHRQLSKPVDLEKLKEALS